MGYIAASVFLVFLLVSALFAPVVAGPLEDGVKAFSHADYAKALKLLEPLAEKGDIDAQYTLGMIYSKGDGVEQDNVKAYMWFSLAARKGDKDAAADRDQVGSGMSPDKLDDAKRRVGEWKAN